MCTEFVLGMQHCEISMRDHDTRLRDSARPLHALQARRCGLPSECENLHSLTGTVPVRPPEGPSSAVGRGTTGGAVDSCWIAEVAPRLDQPREAVYEFRDPRAAALRLRPDIGIGVHVPMPSPARARAARFGTFR